MNLELPPPYTASGTRFVPAAINTSSRSAPLWSNMCPPAFYNRLTRSVKTFLYWLMTIFLCCGLLLHAIPTYFPGNLFSPEVQKVLFIVTFVMVVVMVTLWWDILTRIGTLLRTYCGILGAALRATGESLIEIAAPHAAPLDLEIGNSPELPSRLTKRLLRKNPPLPLTVTSSPSRQSPAPSTSLRSPGSLRSSRSPESQSPREPTTLPETPARPSSNTRGHARKRSKGGSRED
ncbi:hypothetical protein TWF696_001850 [Orbilia brochopaga]|uniref:Uncharacterized protein n=1 Tax=Orbilia brochopaga TaxID=3140254 RepID=A0AAV9U8P6_9PEZI